MQSLTKLLDKNTKCWFEVCAVTSMVIFIQTLTSPKMRKESELYSCHSSSMFESFFILMSKSKEPYIFTANNTHITSVAAATLRQIRYSFHARQLLPNWLSINGGDGWRHNCDATRILNIIIYLYCKSPKPYFVYNGNHQWLLIRLSLPNKTTSRLLWIVIMHHSTTNCNNKM